MAGREDCRPQVRRVVLLMTKELIDGLKAILVRQAGANLLDSEVTTINRCCELLQRLPDEPQSNVQFLQRWMRTPNPMLGNVAPLDMCRMGKGDKLAQFIEAAYELDRSPDEPTGGSYHEAVKEGLANLRSRGGFMAEVQRYQSEPKEPCNGCTNHWPYNKRGFHVAPDGQLWTCLLTRNV